KPSIFLIKSSKSLAEALPVTFHDALGSQMTAQPSMSGFRFGEFSMNVAERQLRRGGECIQLTPKVFDTLLFLVENAGHLVAKDTFLKHLWPDAFVEESSLAQSVSLLRKALGDDGNGSKFIETVPKRGYRFVATVWPLDGKWPSKQMRSRWVRLTAYAGPLVGVAAIWLLSFWARPLPAPRVVGTTRLTNDGRPKWQGYEGPVLLT